jgi:type I restriction enzyme R subunit
MPSPAEYKTVQARILQYAQEIGWMYVTRQEAERRRGFSPSGASAEERARPDRLIPDLSPLAVCLSRPWRIFRNH